VIRNRRKISQANRNQGICLFILGIYIIDACSTLSWQLKQHRYSVKSNNRLNQNNSGVFNYHEIKFYLMIIKKAVVTQLFSFM
jgi:hypothetical protein